MKIITRAEWGARPFRNGPPTVPLSQRREFTIHYPGAGTPPKDVKSYAKWIERIHMDQNGWRGVGYNYFVDAYGAVAEGCGRDVRGAHSPPHNIDGFGVNIWTSNGVPTEAGKRAARELYDHLCQVTGRKLRIGWHGRDFATACPGPLLIAWAKAGMPTSGKKAPADDNRTDFERLLNMYKNKAEFEAAIYAKTAQAIDDSGSDFEAAANRALWTPPIPGHKGNWGASLKDSIARSAYNSTQLRAEVAGLSRAIEALASSQGADPAVIREAARAGVADALGDLEAEVKLTIEKEN